MLIERSIRATDTCELSALWTLAPLTPPWAHHHLSSRWHFSHTDKFVQPRNWKQFIHCHQANTKRWEAVCICPNFLDTSYIYCFLAVVVGNMKQCPLTDCHQTTTDEHRYRYTIKTSNISRQRFWITQYEAVSVDLLSQNKYQTKICERNLLRMSSWMLTEHRRSWQGSKLH